MKKNTMKGTRALLALSTITMIASVVTAQEAADNPSTVEAYGKIGAGIALGLCGIGTGYSQSQIGAAAVGMVADCLLYTSPSPRD